MSIPDGKEKCEEIVEEVDFIHAEGGWGWIVVLATGYCFGCLMGMINNYALIYNEFDKVYNGTPNHIFYAGKKDFSKKYEQKIILVHNCKHGLAARAQAFSICRVYRAQC